MSDVLAQALRDIAAIHEPDLYAPQTVCVACENAWPCATRVIASAALFEVSA